MTENIEKNNLSDNSNGKEKVDIELILKSFKITNLEVFKEYLKEIWIDLTSSSNFIIFI